MKNLIVEIAQLSENDFLHEAEPVQKNLKTKQLELNFVTEKEIFS